GPRDSGSQGPHPRANRRAAEGDRGDREAGGLRLPRSPPWDRVQRMDGGLVRANQARLGGRGRTREEDRLMLDSLARFVYRRRRVVAIGAAAFFIFAAAVGSSVAERLDPYGADDPATDSVKADELLQERGYRDPSVIVWMRDAPVANPQTRARVEGIER